MHRRDFTKNLSAALGAFAIGTPRFGSTPRHGAGAQQGAPRINGDRLNAALTALSEFGKNPQGGVTRLAYSDADLAGRKYVLGLMREAKLDVRIDEGGNILGRRAGSDPSLKPLLFGSHIDSVPEGGNFDGPVGSLGAIEVARTLSERGVITRHPLEVVIFQNEEGGTVGSRAMIGELTEKNLALVARSGKTLGDGITAIGGNLAALERARRSKGDVAAYLELHIEQGGNLDREKLDIGVVEGIVGIGWWDVTIEGFANHAGTTAMNERRDAMLAAARFTEMVNRIARTTPGRQVGTVGRIQAFPGAPNVIPGKVVCSLELRDLDDAKIRALYDQVRQEATRIGTDTGTTFSYANTHDSHAALMDPRLQGVIERTARSLNLTSRRLPSGAGHDAQHMARITPSAMIFVPSVGGISHAPSEFTKAQDITNGANVLLHTLLALDAAP